MGCGPSVQKEEFPGTAPGSVRFGPEAEIAITQKLAASATTTAQVADNESDDSDDDGDDGDDSDDSNDSNNSDDSDDSDAETDNPAKVVVVGTSAEVKAAAKAEAARQGEDWGRLAWPRRQELCGSASATVLQTRTAAQPPAVQALCTQLCSVEPPAATVANDTSPPFPRLGVSLALLHLLAPLVPDGATTAEACFNTFKPLSSRARSSVADCLLWLKACDPTTQLPYVATATVFASHAWKYEFALLLASLDAFAAAQSSPAEVYIWFDCVVVNQHASAVPQEWWSTAFAAGIQTIGHTCLVLSPWRDPLPLTRCPP